MEEKKENITSKSGQYEVIRMLGEGYTGQVFLVKDLTRQEPVALKLLNPEAFKEGQLKAFKREFMLLSDLHHPHVCKVYDFGFSEDRGRYFFTLELVQGISLYKYVDSLSIEEIEEIFIQITDALGFIHSAGLIHFDVKGDNILITTAANKPLAKIVDFGLAAPSFETPENIAGTIRYMSPEMITKIQSIDYRADLYSLGIVLYRMLAREYPKQGNTMKEVLNWHIHHTAIDKAPLEARGAPKYLIEVIEKLIRSIPTERFSSASVIIKYIELHSGKTYTKTQKNLVATLMEEGPLVARDHIMVRIKSALHQLGQKAPLTSDLHQTLVLSGSPGSGKSRIIKETKYIAQLAEVSSVTVSGENAGKDMQLFKKAIGLENVEDNKLAEFLISRQPLCVMVDNLDKCNQQVKEFVAGLANFLYSSKFLGNSNLVYLIVSMTTENQSDPLPIPLHLDVDHEHLPPLTPEDITQYIRLSLGESNPPVKQVQDIFRFSGGIPELVKAAIASLDSPTARVAKSAEQHFVDRFRNVDQAAMSVLGYIVLADKPLNQQQLITLSGLIVETALTKLIQEGLINYDRESNTYKIATGAISIAAQKIIPEKNKKDMATKLLGYFEEESPGDIDSIVKYASIGAEPAVYGDYLVKAGEGKEKKSELEDSCRYYSQAVKYLSDSDPRLPEIHRKLVRQLILIGKYSEASEHIEAASKLTGVTTQDLTSRSWMSRLQYKPDAALGYIEEAIYLTGEDNKNPEYLRLLNEKASCYLQMGKIDEGLKIFQDTNKSAKGLPEKERRRVTNNNLGLALAQKGRYDEAIEFYKNKYEYFSGEPQLAASILSQLGYVYQQAGLLSEGLETSKKSWEIHSNIGDTHSAMAILGNIIAISQAKALYTDALDYVRVSIQIVSSSGSDRQLAENFLKLGDLYINLGLEDVARRYLNEAAAVFQRLEDHRMEAWAQLSFGYLYKNLGRYKEALAYMDNVIKRGKEYKYDDLVLWGSHGAADISLDIGSVTKAEKYLSNVHLEWIGKENAREGDLKIEALRCRLSLVKNVKPPLEIAERLKELADRAEKLELRELVSEIYHNLGTLYQKLDDNAASVKYISKAREIIEDIAGTLSEEYRESFLKQRFREKVYQDSIRLKDFISQFSLDEEDLQQKGTATDVVKKEEYVKAEKSVYTSEDSALPAETSVITGEAGKDIETEIIGQSEAVFKVRELVAQVCDSNVPVLITGEDGTGKELVARMICKTGSYKDKAWKKIDISTYSEAFLEGILWGKSGEGVFESVGEGIVFMTNIEKMTPSLQKKLVKVIEKKKFNRLTDGKELPFKARILVSSRMEPDSLIKKAKLDKGLVKRLTEVVIHIPPLRERRADIPLLISHFLIKIGEENKPGRNYSLEPKALKLMISYAWPGNIRELEQTIRSACVLSEDGNISEEQISVYITPPK